MVLEINNRQNKIAVQSVQYLDGCGMKYHIQIKIDYLTVKGFDSLTVKEMKIKLVIG